MEIFNLIPVWVYLVVALIIVIFVYFKVLDDTTRESVKGGLFKYMAWIILIVLFIYGRYNWGYWEASDTIFHWSRISDTLFTVFGLVILLGVQFLGKMRYLSTQAVCDNRSGSCSQYEEIGDYVVLNIGTCDADLFPWYAGHETWCIPKRHFNKINGIVNKTKSQIVIKTFVSLCDLTELPAQCHDFIESSKGYNKENIYYGEFSRMELDGDHTIKTDVKDIELEDYAEKLKDTQRLLNESRAMVKGKTKSILGYVSHVGEIMKKAKGTENKQQYREEGRGDY